MKMLLAGQWVDRIDVEPSEILDGRRDEGLECVLVADIDGSCEYLDALGLERFLGCFDALGAAGANGYVTAFCCEGFGCRAADATTPAGDDGPAAFEFEIHVVSCWGWAPSAKRRGWSAKRRWRSQPPMFID